MASKKPKIIDKWKAKKWYSVVAPSMFDNKEIAEVVATEESNLLNRIVSASLMDLGVAGAGHGGMFTKLKFRIKEVKGNTAYTRIIGHMMASSFLKTLARRGKSLIHYVVDEKTKDDETVRMKMIAVTGARVSMNTKKNIRATIEKEIRELVKENTYDKLMEDIVYGRATSKLFQKLKKITMMRRVEIRKTELTESFK